MELGRASNILNKFSQGFLSCHTQTAAWYLKLGPEHFLPHPFPCINRSISLQCMSGGSELQDSQNHETEKNMVMSPV
jgi:hypothetical protein